MSTQPAMIEERLWFPDPAEALTHPNGLLAIGGDLSVARLLLAYRSGIFPWTAHPVTWWSPDPRAIIELDGLHISRSLARTLKRQPFEITRDRAFRRVMKGCATTRRNGNWITPAFLDAYAQLHAAGHAHSVECWKGGVLVGGIYGVAVGGFFAGESMFHLVNDASKVALVALVEHLRARGFALFDIQMVTPTTAKFGAMEIRRAEYLERLHAALDVPARF
jgi:leucyl/phenylalanyl-tRNA--protein transferase